MRGHHPVSWGPEQNKRVWEGGIHPFCFCRPPELGHQSCSVLGLGFIPLTPWFSGLQIQTRMTPPDFLGLQLIDGRLWDFSASIIVWANSSQQWGYTRSYRMCMLSCFSCVWLFATLWTIALQASLSMGFSRQEDWSGLSFPALGDLPNPGFEPASLKSPALAGRSFTTSTIY